MYKRQALHRGEVGRAVGFGDPVHDLGGGGDDPVRLDAVQVPAGIRHEGEPGGPVRLDAELVEHAGRVVHGGAEALFAGDQGGFGTAAGGVVDRDGADAVDRAVGVGQRDARDDVLADVVAERQLLQNRPGVAGAGHLGVVRAAAGGDRGRQHVLLAAPDHVGGADLEDPFVFAVDEQVAPVQVLGRDHRGRVLQDRVDQLVAALQILAGLVPLGLVGDERAEAGRPERVQVHGDGELGAVAVHGGHLVAVAHVRPVADRDAAGEPGVVPGPQRRRDDGVGQRDADHLVAGPAEQPLGGRVPVLDQTGAVDLDVRQGGRVDGPDPAVAGHRLLADLRGGEHPRIIGPPVADLSLSSA